MKSNYEQLLKVNGRYKESFLNELTGNGSYKEEYMKYLKFLISNHENKCHIKRLGIFIITQSNDSVKERAKYFTNHFITMYGTLPEDIFKLCGDVIFTHCNATLEAFKDNLKPEFKMKMYKYEQVISDYCKSISEEYVKMINEEFKYDKESKMQNNVIRCSNTAENMLQPLDEEEKKLFLSKFFDKYFDKFTRSGCLIALEEATRSNKNIK